MRKVTLSDEQLNELKSMMNQGIPQLQIAAHFSMTDDTLRRIQKEAGLTVQMPYVCTCALCGREFRSNVKTAKTCSDVHMRKCVVCGTEFEVDRYRIADTCSRKCTSLLKYGTAHPSQSQVVKDRREDTFRIRYGASSPLAVEKFKEKAEATSLERYGAKHYSETDEYKTRVMQINSEKYGCAWSLGADSLLRAQIKQANYEKYGVEYPNNLVKQKQTLEARYGVDNAMQSPQVVEKFKKTMQARYGVTSPMHVPETLQKLSDTVQERYNVPWACMRPEARQHSAISSINKSFEARLTALGINSELEFRIDNKSFDIKVDNTLVEIDPTVTHNSAVSIFPQTSPIDPTYHLLKSTLASQNGYRCIHVFDWDNWDSIISLLLPKQSLYARKCTVSEIDEATAVQFTNAYHIQESCKGQTLNYGLFDNYELVEVMTFGKPRYTKKYDWELLRLCARNDVNIVGGASRLFKHFLDNTEGSVVSYCDLAKFRGDVYPLIGMSLHHVSDPAKVWSKGGKRITDNLLRQRGYDQLFGTNFGKGTSNEELMLADGWLPVYDCGQAVFEYLR